MSIFHARRSAAVPDMLFGTPPATPNGKKSLSRRISGTTASAKTPQRIHPPLLAAPSSDEQHHEVFFVRGRPFIAPVASKKLASRQNYLTPATGGDSTHENELRLKQATIINSGEQKLARQRSSVILTGAGPSSDAVETLHLDTPLGRRSATSAPEATTASGSVASAPLSATKHATVKTSLASAGKIAEEEWAALFRNNLLRSCWKPGLSADEVQFILTQWEKKLVHSMHQWRKCRVVSTRSTDAILSSPPSPLPHSPLPPLGQCTLTFGRASASGITERGRRNGST